jgi:hypothetical protein
MNTYNVYHRKTMRKQNVYTLLCIALVCLSLAANVSARRLQQEQYFQDSTATTQEDRYCPSDCSGICVQICPYMCNATLVEISKNSTYSMCPSYCPKVCPSMCPNLCKTITEATNGVNVTDTPTPTTNNDAPSPPTKNYTYTLPRTNLTALLVSDLQNSSNSAVFSTAFLLVMLISTIWIS